MTALRELPATTFPEPASATAAAPAEWRGLQRDEVRLLTATPDGVRHDRFRDLGRYLHPGDLLVVNNSAVEARQLDATLGTRGPVVAHLAQPLEPQVWVVELRTSPDAARAILDARAGDRVVAGAARLTLLAPHGGVPSSPTGHGNRLWRARVDGPLEDELRAHGRPIAYGYLDRRYPLSAYQSVFARRPGSAESPSASRPFTPELVTRSVSAGIGFAPVTLHTGVSSQEAGEAPGPEWFEVPAATAQVVQDTLRAGRRVIAVGTTAARALESAAIGVTRDGVTVAAASGWTDRVITPAKPPLLVNGLITGWHDPHASHLLLVEAIAGADLTQRAYDEAGAAGYLWHEFGDAALMLP